MSDSLNLMFIEFTTMTTLSKNTRKKQRLIQT